MIPLSFFAKREPEENRTLYKAHSLNLPPHSLQAISRRNMQNECPLWKLIKTDQETNTDE